MITPATWFTKTHKSTVDLILTNKKDNLRNKTTEENEKLNKKQRDRCISIRKKSIRNYINKIVKVFNEHYINIIEKSGGEKTTKKNPSEHKI